MIDTVKGGWGEAIGARMKDTDRVALEEFLANAWAPGNPPVYPSQNQVFAAFEMTPLKSVRAVILGQDPYPNPGEACGLAFSVPHGVPRPLSLQRIIAKVEDDLHCNVPDGSTLEPWARDSHVLLLNTALTVEAGVPNSHRAVWRPFTKAVLEVLAKQPQPIVFLLWGQNARSRRQLIGDGRHFIIESAHPAARLSREDPDSFASKHPFRETQRLVDWSLWE